MKKKLKLSFHENESIKRLIRTMKTVVVLLFVCTSSVWASTYAQSAKLSINVKNVPLEDVIQLIEDKSEFYFLYKDEMLDVSQKVDINITNASIEDILNRILPGDKVKYEIRDRQILILKKEHAQTGPFAPQVKSITGKVINTTGEPIPGATVIIKGSTKGTVTNHEGNFSLTEIQDGSILIISFVGMKSQEIEVKEKDQLVVVLEDDFVGVEEVVVTALGIERQEKALGFAAQELGQTDLEGAREGNISNTLAGKVAGLRVSKTSSGMGGSTSVVIRGASSLKGSNQPLYVVDGVPITNIGHSSGGISGDTDTGDGIGDINSEDVESMSILKGPSASALYGSRGSNGVILITTKSGSKKKGIGVEINSNTSVETINLMPERQNKYGTGYGTYIGSSTRKVGGEYYPVLDNIIDNWGPPLDGTLTVVDPYVYPGEENTRTMALVAQPKDNIRNFYQTGVSTSNTIAISGSGEKTTARISLGNSTNKGILPNWKLNKQTVSISANSQVTDFLSFTGKFMYIRDEGNNRPYLGGGGNNVSQYLMYMARYVPMDFLKEYYENTGEYGSFPGVYYNPYYMVNELKNNDVKDRYIGQVSMNLKLNSWLSIMGRVGSDMYTQKIIKKWPVGARGSDYSAGRLINSVDIIKDINADFILTANKNISEDFNLNGIIGTSISHQHREGWTMNGYNFKASGVYNISNCQTVSNSEYLERKEIQSVYFTGQVGYKNYLFLDVTGRNDWSSTLGVNNYSFFYPSVSTSFIFTEAIKSIPPDILAFGKLRASWAQVGNDSSPYLTTSGYALTTDTYGGQNLTNMDSGLPLVDLKNELTESWELGADLRFLQNRIGFDFTYYNGKTTNQIVPMNVSSSSVVINAGEIQNKGFEMVLNLSPVKTLNGFNWDINLNYAKNKSEVVEIGPGIESLTLASSSYAGITEARVGRPYGEIVGYAYKKAPNGQRIVSDLGYYVATSEKKVIGNISPDWTGGFNNTFSYKGFTLNVLLDIVQGNNIMSNTMYMLEGKGLAKHTLEGRREQFVDENGNEMPYVGVLDGVLEVDDGNGNISYVKNNIAVSGMDYWAQRAWGNITEQFVLDGGYVSLREVVFSYKLSPSLLRKTPFAGITISAIGRNLLYLKEHMKDMGISPESSPNTSAGYAGMEMYSMPSTRTWGFNVKFNL